MSYGPFRRFPVAGARTAAVAVAVAVAGGCGASTGSAGSHPQVYEGVGHEQRNPGNGVREGTFKLLDTRPPGMDEVRGTARLVQRGGTMVSAALTGLRPGGDYVAHLHARPCADDYGGPHFKFDPEGPDTPPNEVHLRFTADRRGEAAATTYNEREVGDAAPSIVVHPAEAMERRIACADFS